MPPRAVLVPVAVSAALLAALAFTFTPGHRGPPGDLLQLTEKAAATLMEAIMR